MITMFDIGYKLGKLVVNHKITFRDFQNIIHCLLKHLIPPNTTSFGHAEQCLFSQLYLIN